MVQDRLADVRQDAKVRHARGGRAAKVMQPQGTGLPMRASNTTLTADQPEKAPLDPLSPKFRGRSLRPSRSMAGLRIEISRSDRGPHASLFFVRLPGRVHFRAARSISDRSYRQLRCGAWPVSMSRRMIRPWSSSCRRSRSPPAPHPRERDPAAFRRPIHLPSICRRRQARRRPSALFFDRPASQFARVHLGQKPFDGLPDICVGRAVSQEEFYAPR
jgi:hypothetical protein